MTYRLCVVSNVHAGAVTLNPLRFCTVNWDGDRTTHQISGENVTIVDIKQKKIRALAYRFSSRYSQWTQSPRIRPHSPYMLLGVVSSLMCCCSNW